MDRFTQRDLRSLLRFLRTTYAMRDFEGFVANLLKGLSDVVPCDVTSYNEMNVMKASSQNWLEPAEFGNPERAQAWERVMHEHPVLIHQQRTHEGEALKITDFLADRQFRRLALYNEHYWAMRTDRMIGFTLTISPAFAIGVGLQRRRRDFTERERLLLNVLRPHLLQAYRNANAVTLLLEALDRGIVILGRNGRVQLMTVKSRRCLKEYFGARPIERGRLPDALQRWIEHQHRVLAVDDDLPPPRPQLLVKQGEKRLIVRHIPHWSQDLLLFEEQLEAPKPAAFGAFGLTQREAEVLSWVAEGKTNADIGIIIGAGTRTVEKHLERIFQKLGVETRTAASVFALQARKVER